MHEDNSEKPSYHALKQLIHGEWETHETLTADAEGWVTFTGFKGAYRLVSGERKADIELHDELCASVELS